MELPNYSKQLMQQLRSLRKGGHFCDCTILVGDSPHQAHKVVLAASSMLFRSLLDGSDTISIDTAVVSSQEFELLLDMAYTGRLPPGKHNISRIIVAADSLQMFDVAVGCQNILTSLMPQPTTPCPAVVTPTKEPAPNHGAEVTSFFPQMVASILGKSGVKSESPAAKVQALVEIKKESGGRGSQRKDVDEEQEEEEEEWREEDGPPSKIIRVLVPGGPEQTEDIKSQARKTTPVEEEDTVGFTKSDESSSALLERSSELTELLAHVPSIMELLIQAAHSSLGGQEREVVCECCKAADLSMAMDRLMGKLREGSLSGAGLLALLRAVQEKVPPSSHSPRLMSLLEEVEEQTQEVGGGETGATETQEEEEPHPSPGTADHSTNEEEEPEADAEEEVNREQKKKQGEEKTKTGKAKTSSLSSTSMPYTCRWCKKGFAYKCRVSAHAKRCSLSQEVKLQCPLCPKMLPTPRALQTHRTEAHPDAAKAKKKVACDLCGRTFAHSSGMIYHKRTEHFEEKPFACEECGAKFGANSSLKNHMRLHTGEKPYHCKHCDMSFSVAAALAYHTKKKHSEGKMYACQYCEAVFAQSIELTRHVRTHTGDKPYVCRECGKGYSQASGLTLHLQTFHNISEPHDCQKCHLSFSSLEEHRQHIQEVHPKEYHRCHVCHKVFTSAALLDKHRTTHTGAKPFSCEHCHKFYQQLSGLWYHNRTNHPEVFANQSHRQLKTLVQCDACFKFFPNIGSLTRHQQAEHAGLIDTDGRLLESTGKTEKLFSCQEEMQEHADNQHFGQESSAFGCSLCSLVFPTHLQLQEHFFSCHMGALQEGEEGEGEEQASTSHPVTKMEQSADDDKVEQVISLDQSQLGKSEQVFVALGDGENGGSSSEVVAVNMDDLLNGTVAFICGDNQ